VAPAPAPALPEAVEKKKKKTSKKETRPKRPRAPTSYMLFASDLRLQKLDEFKGLSLTDVSKACGQAWQTLTEVEKTVWKDKSNAAREQLLIDHPPPEAKPRRPVSGYILFSLEERIRCKSQHPGLKPTEVTKLCGEAWNTLSAHEREAWKVRATGSSGNS
jgi:hypothetical protein